MKTIQMWSRSWVHVSLFIIPNMHCFNDAVCSKSAKQFLVRQYKDY